MIRIFVFIVCIVGFFLDLSANDVRIRGEAKVQAMTETTALITFPLSWEHSWRAPESWDAVYLFVKYRRVGVNEPWHHAYLKNSGHRAVGGGDMPAMEFLAVETGGVDILRYDTLGYGNFNQTPISNTSEVPGVFLYRRTPGTGNLNIPRVSLEWDFTKGDLGLYYNVTADDIRNKKIEVSVQAVEMVYVPNGPYYLGDRISSYSFVSKDFGSAFYMNTDDSVRVYMMGTTGSTGWKSSWVIPKFYPTGYTGFYTMKYEVSQEQYVNFLNRLTYQDQKKRIGNDLDGMRAGDFAFGAKGQSNFRNGILLQQRFANNDTAVIFGFDLNPDNPINADNDGKSIACNYLAPPDLNAYADWAGLRPNSEMEYEKGCRQRDPAVASNSRSFAWGTPTFESLKLWNSTTMANDNAEDEQVLIPAVAPKGRMNGPKVHNLGPVRCGAFAFETSDIYMAGASRWGLMEMTGNLAEIYYNARRGGSFNGEAFGDGNIWSSVASWRADSTVHLYYEKPVHVCGKGYLYAYDTLRLPTISKKNKPMIAIVRYRQPYDYGESWNCGYQTIDVKITVPWPVLEWPGEKENFILRGGSFATEAGSTSGGDLVADKMAVSYRGDTIYDKIMNSEIRREYAGMRAGRSVPMKSILTGVIAGENLKNRDTAAVCQAHNYTIREIETGDDTPTTTVYVWEMNDQEKGWVALANENSADLVIRNCLVDNVLMHEYKFRRKSIASHAQSYGNEVTLVVPGYQTNGGKSELLIGKFESSIELNTLLGISGDVKVEWRLDNMQPWALLSQKTGVTTDKIFLNRSDFDPAIPLNDGGVGKVLVTVTIDGCDLTKELDLVIKAGEAACPATVKDADNNSYDVVQLADGKCWMKQDLRVKVDGVPTGGLYNWAQIEDKGDALCPAGFALATQQDWDYLWRMTSVYGETGTCFEGDASAIPPIPATQDYVSSADPAGCGWGWGLYYPGVDKFVNDIGLNKASFTNGTNNAWWATGVIGRYVVVMYDASDLIYGYYSSFATDNTVINGDVTSKRPVRCLRK